MNRTVPRSREAFDRQNAESRVFLPIADDVSCLSEPLNIIGKTVPNRLVCQAMEGCDGTYDGKPGELTRRRYLRLASGGAGIIWFEATACCFEGRANPRQLWINKKNVDAFRALLDEIRETALTENGYVPLIIMQDTHSGRYSKPHGVPEPLIAYNNPLFEKDKPIDHSRILTDEQLDRVRDELVEKAGLAEKAGFDGVDIKCCHRYLNCELLSAFTRKNSRYGESYENRTRLLRESVAGAMQSCSASFIVSTRLNIYDGFVYPYGWGVKHDGSLTVDLTEPKKLVKELADKGMKLINLTMGNPYVNPHVNRPFAKGPYEDEEHPLAGVKRMLDGIAEVQASVPDVPVISSALSYLGTASAGTAAAYIRERKFALAGFGRLILADPDFAKEILTNGAPDAGKLCLACSKCTELMRAGGTPGCVVRDPVYTKLYREMKIGK